jgi:hypothetical protein
MADSDNMAGATAETPHAQAKKPFCNEEARREATGAPEHHV